MQFLETCDAIREEPVDNLYYNGLEDAFSTAGHMVFEEMAWDFMHAFFLTQNLFFHILTSPRSKVLSFLIVSILLIAFLQGNGRNAKILPDIITPSHRIIETYQ